jgi:zinc transporter ZupT
MIDLDIPPVQLGFVVGLFPALSMFVASVVLANYQVSPHVEAAFQNFCAGLIISAVASELFPLMSEGTAVESVIGEILGFVLGLSAIYGLEHVIEKISESENTQVSDVAREDSRGSNKDW